MAKSKRPIKRKKAGKVRPQQREWRMVPAENPPMESARQAPVSEGAAQDQPQVEDGLPGSKSEFGIVGVGASAGGLEAFTQFLKAMPSDTGMAIILVQHLSPRHESVLPELLSGATSMPVYQVSEGMEIRPDHVYVMPPNVSMGISAEGKFHLSPRPHDRTQHTPIDTFFRSLAEYAQQRAIGVILSGTAADGSQGLKELKAVGGFTMAQDPTSAKYDGMPRAAIATGVVDMVLPPQGIASELNRIGHHPLVRTITVKRAGDDLEVNDEHLARIFKILRNATGVDFTYYKQPTIRRRLQRRMVLHKITGIEQYLKFLQQNPDEVHALYADILIHVTRFFREPESFETLGEVVFPAILAARQQGPARDEPIRVWTPGCATGEEAYSVAMALLEFLEDHAIGGIPIQIFATDISDSAIELARAGVYAESITEDVSQERLRRFFTRIDGSYKVNKQVRDLCVFARQDLTRDPPFSKLDLIICRNVLIYLSNVLQKRLMGMFHYALKPTGFLLLGSAETIGSNAELFGVADKRHRLYIRKTSFIRADMNFTPAEPVAARHAERVGEAAAPGRTSNTLHADANRLILERFSPPAVILDSDLRIIQFRGHTGTFLEAAPGDASLSVLKMAREGLLYGLRSALNECRRSGKASRKQGLRVRQNGEMHTVNLEVVPMDGPIGDRHFLVLFHDLTPGTIDQSTSGGKEGRKSGKKPRTARDAQIKRLGQELAASRDYLQSIIQDLEAANEELQSANEEILSSNEELQSTNEELDTAKEELQSTNEELNTVNEELHGRNEELSQANSDLINLLASVHIAIVMVARDLRIRRFTPMAEKVLNLIPTDIGRPITDLKPNIECPNLDKLISEAIDGVVMVEREVKDRQGRTLSLRIRPYKNLENRIDGAVVAIFDLEPERRQQLESAQATELFQEMLNLVSEPAIVLDEDFRIIHHNPAFVSQFRQDGLRGLIYEVMDEQLDVDRLRVLLEEMLPKHGRVDRFELGKSDGKENMRVSARQVRRGTQMASIVLAFSK